MSQQLKDRTKDLGLRVIRMAKELKYNKIVDILLRQILRSSTSVGANYRSALRSRSRSEFISKLKIAEEEADETCYWLEIMIDVGVFPKERMEPLLQEAKEITAILSAASITAKKKQDKSG